MRTRDRRLEHLRQLTSRRAAPLTLGVACAAVALGCTTGAERRARAAERTNAVIIGEVSELGADEEEPESVIFPPASVPPPHHPRGGLLPFERRAGMSEYGAEGAIPGPPDLDFAPAPDADRVLIDVARAVQDDAALRGAVGDLDVDDEGGTLVVRGVVASPTARDEVERLARDAARGRMVRSELAVSPAASARAPRPAR